VFRKPNPSSGIPIYKQLKDQVRHLIETGVLKPGDQLPSMRVLAESLVVNPNTVARIYHELELEGVITISHGLGAFISNKRKSNKEKLLKDAQTHLNTLIDKLIKQGIDQNEIRRLVEAALIPKEKTSSKEL
jgi:GntR family transcriptional regulator